MIPITILLVDDHVVVREGFRKLIETEIDLVVIGEAHNGREGVTLALQLHPEIVVMDIAMPGLNGLVATRQLEAKLPSAKVIILSAYNDEAYVEEVFRAGAKGYLLKQCSALELHHAIRDVHGGKTKVMSAHFKLLNPLALTASKPARSSKAPAVLLTSRETEVLQLIAESMPSKAIAMELGIGIKTVEKHREHLMEKLRIHDIAKLTHYAVRHGIVERS